MARRRCPRLWTIKDGVAVPLEEGQPKPMINWAARRRSGRQRRQSPPSADVPIPGANRVINATVHNCGKAGVFVAPGSSPVILENLNSFNNATGIENHGIIQSRGAKLRNNTVGIDNSGSFDGPDTIIE